LRLVAESDGGGSGAVRVGRRLVLPGLNNRKAARPGDLLECLETGIPGFVAARRGELPDIHSDFADIRCGRLEIGYPIYGATVRCRGSRPYRGDGRAQHSDRHHE
jgi:hypothetical protein